MMGDYRFIFNPWYEKKYSPFIYGGVGGSYDLSESDADVIPHIPLGLGLQTQLKTGDESGIHPGLQSCQFRRDGW